VQLDRITFKDHFSSRAEAYTTYRPSYPSELFAWLGSLTSSHELAWDCGCGNGQASLGLVPYFARVIATDPSEQQIENAMGHERIDYRVATAEDSGIDGSTVDLVVTAQALHWFDFERFYDEVRRVARHDAVLAAISYGEVHVEGKPDSLVGTFYHDIIGPYWPPERHYVDEHYRTIPFPFKEIVSPPFAMEIEWDLGHLVGYLGTWSAVKEYEKQRGCDPLSLIRSELGAAWGNPLETRRIRWPLSLRVGLIGARP
jgi:SAM-dependent methyltransferase